jgi:hypothetical protein
MGAVPNRGSNEMVNKAHNGIVEEWNINFAIDL